MIVSQNDYECKADDSDGESKADDSDGESKDRPVATNFQFLKIICPSGTSLLKLLRVSEVLLLERACPKLLPDLNGITH